MLYGKSITLLWKVQEEMILNPGITVMVELTEHKRTGRLTGGTVKEVLTTAPISIPTVLKLN